MACALTCCSRCISTLQDLFHATEISDKVEHEFEALERSAMAYVKAWAREEGEVMGVVDSLCTNSREICKQVRDWDSVLVCVVCM